MAVRVFLVPGFFGFANLGDFAYFSHVREVLSDALEQLGTEAEIHSLATLPTCSIGARAGYLLEQVLEATDDADSVHLVGHSTGGLDARFLVASTADLPRRDEVIQRIRSVVTIATPHRGAPAASFFTSMLGSGSCVCSR